MASHAIGVLGAGYVGLTTAACLARLGHAVTCVDIDEPKVAGLRRGEVPITEPGLAELVSGPRYTTDHRELAAAEFVFVCVPTPMGEGGQADLSGFDGAVDALRPVLRPGTVLVVKSTVPIGTADRLARAWPDHPVVSNPEFLREGHAVEDFLHPGRVVIGSDDGAAARRTAALYAGLGAPVVRTGPASAELAKYASNAYLALRLSYVNVLSELCEQVGADVGTVTRVMGLDARIGPACLDPGPGWGGSCLPKDTAALARSAADLGVDPALLRAAVAVNERQPGRVAEKVRAVVGADGLDGIRLGLLGLTFKAGTSDLRDSPALAVARRLAAEGAVLTGYDPAVPAASPQVAPVQAVDDPSLVAKGAAAIVVLTEWPEFTALDWAQLAGLAEGDAVIDTRRLLDPAKLRSCGLTCLPLGGQ
ncbi:UDP-glucose/GDP-mannose dehydrogenase family protein [Amycolatopsis rhizosphaerae]|uniref:UDP-glucose 6-dehydrogenase n=1 Tax=Amycolatopsis rhizosphaerae TaxID=2053003 RepID=A0A558BC24_9PSEU|nr:UDP-glucose/GDP-mannose dehydrogenase family protein [Amycolatopsis rhizosphaerae]TVT34062.1 UDP-glucose/GDP-mannose dehydrogenase family protein [Amycolatopsis rhizosphaerae]